MAHRTFLVALLETLRAFARNVVENIRVLINCTHCNSLNPISSTSEETMDPTIPTTPIAYPIIYLKDLEDRTYFNSFHFPFNKASFPLAKSQIPSHEKRPRLLACHDMQGGYQDDKWIQGNSNCDAYSLWHWHLLDIFVYFSHSLVTLPPPCWTNTAHRHGVQVLGTFITEWDEGAAICACLLESKDSAEMYASRLAELADVLGFDGWLINIENEIGKEHVDNLKHFVDHLTKSMHKLVPGSLIIWYDSVTEEGHLQWQDCLSELNKCFFDVCDGIFTNYTWRESFPAKSASLAGDRQYDVYMGIDVFGRNTYGGGGFQSDIALSAAREAGVSAALFAPAWVYEQKLGPTFEIAQNRWWGLVANVWPSRQLYPLEVPFFSDFNKGYGKSLNNLGDCISNMMWSNISCQNLQPFLNTALDNKEGSFQVLVSSEGFAYNGSCCTKFCGKLMSTSHCLTTLYKSIANVGSTPLLITYSPLVTMMSTNYVNKLCARLGLTNLDMSDYNIQPFLFVKRALYNIDSKEQVMLGSNCRFCLLLTMQDVGREKLFFLMGRNDDAINIPQGYYNNSSVVFEYPTTDSNGCSNRLNQEWEVRKYSLSLSEGLLKGIYAVCFMENLDYMKIVDLLGKQDISLVSQTSNSGLEEPNESFHALLGHISIAFSQAHDCFEPAINLEGGKVYWDRSDSENWLLNMLLVWGSGRSSDSKILRYNVYVQKRFGDETKKIEYIGVSVFNLFYISDLSVQLDCSSLTFYLQPCCRCGVSLEIQDTPQFQLLVPLA